MLKKARKEKILDLVNHNGYVTLEFLARELETSESTIRRDLTELDRAHELKRLHGGAESLVSLRYEENVAEKSVKHVSEKKSLLKKQSRNLKMVMSFLWMQVRQLP